VKKIYITATKEEYIRMIYLLSLQNIDGVRSVDIADRLHINKSTVSESLKELLRQKLISYKKYSDIKLTKKGKILGNKLTYRHRILEVFLHRTLHIPVSSVHREADKLEHGFSDEVISKLAKFLDLPNRDPHGKTISLDKKEGNL
jgi:DtxR family transcriptional regulator, Mn-dependent transcriptional regulator